MRALALRMEGVPAARCAFAAGDDVPDLAGAIPSLYTSDLDLEAAAIELIVDMVAAYLRHPYDVGVVVHAVRANRPPRREQQSTPEPP